MFVKLLFIHIIFLGCLPSGSIHQHLLFYMVLPPSFIHAWFLWRYSFKKLHALNPFLGCVIYKKKGFWGGTFLQGRLCHEESVVPLPLRLIQEGRTPARMASKKTKNANQEERQRKNCQENCQEWQPIKWGLSTDFRIKTNDIQWSYGGISWGLGKRLPTMNRKAWHQLQPRLFPLSFFNPHWGFWCDLPETEYSNTSQWLISQ